MARSDDDSLSDDLLIGALAIAKFLYGPRAGKAERQRIYYHANGRADRKKNRSDYLPIFRQGTQIMARKSELRAQLSAHAKKQPITETQPAA